MLPREACFSSCKKQLNLPQTLGELTWVSEEDKEGDEDLSKTWAVGAYPHLRPTNDQAKPDKNDPAKKE